MKYYSGFIIFPFKDNQPSVEVRAGKIKLGREDFRV